jgi:hypothetical protein
MLQKVILKLFDILLNILVIKNIDKEVYGINLLFDLYMNISLYFLKTCLKNSY